MATTRLSLLRELERELAMQTPPQLAALAAVRNMITATEAELKKDIGPPTGPSDT